jgi:hypothetical protein
MNTELSSEASEFGRVARDAFAAAGHRLKILLEI